MKKYEWLLDLVAQTVFSVVFTLLSVGSVVGILSSI